MAVAPSIALSDSESTLVNLLDGCCRWINANKPQPPEEEGGSHVDYARGGPLEARIAGGWVRDKLLGLPSNDLDISLSLMTGLNFAILFKRYLSEAASAQGAAASQAAEAMSRISKIAANPEQSKNLETATATFNGLSLDFVNLRKEVYHGDSRIPVMEFGSPLEDAERRDITINSLFFNVHSHVVEDCTGKGLVDMKDGLVRTPLSPLTTFLDDPLRILRCVRFASRFNYRLDDSIVACLKGTGHVEASDDPRLQGIGADEVAQRGRDLVREALIHKVSRERVGIEVDKMMKGAFPLLAHYHLEDLDLHSIVFDPASLIVNGKTLAHRRADADLDNASSARLAFKLSQLLDALSPQPISQRTDSPLSIPTTALTHFDSNLIASVPPQIKAPLADAEQRRRLEYLCALIGNSQGQVEEKKGKWMPASEAVLLHGLKLGRSTTAQPVSSLVHAATQLLPRPLDDLDAIKARAEASIPNLPHMPAEELGILPLVTLFLRDKHLTNSPLAMHPSTALTAAFLYEAGKSNDSSPELWSQPYSPLLHLISSHDIYSRLEEKPVLDGNAVLALLNLKPGPMTTRILNAVLVWQFGRPRGEVEGEEGVLRAGEWVKGMWEGGWIVPVEERVMPPVSKKVKQGK